MLILSLQAFCWGIKIILHGEGFRVERIKRMHSTQKEDAKANVSAVFSQKKDGM